MRMKQELATTAELVNSANRQSPPRDESLNYPWHSASPESEMPGNDPTEKKASWRIRDRWLFDADNEPSVGPDGPDEKDRVLVDEFHPKYARLGNYNLIIHC
jgi:enhancer of polycomb-like protein